MTVTVTDCMVIEHNKTVQYFSFINFSQFYTTNMCDVTMHLKINTEVSCCNIFFRFMQTAGSDGCISLTDFTQKMNFQQNLSYTYLYKIKLR